MERDRVVATAGDSLAGPFVAIKEWLGHDDRLQVDLKNVFLGFDREQTLKLSWDELRLLGVAIVNALATGPEGARK